MTRRCSALRIGAALPNRTGLGLPLLVVLVSAIVLVGAPDQMSAQTAPTVKTDKVGYTAGETTTILGSGFSSSEGVTLQVTHVDGTAEAGMGHESQVVQADATGAFAATWSVNVADSMGNDFVVTALGEISGSSTPALFSRIALVKTHKRHYEAGETARITGSFFRGGEPVSLQVQHIPATTGGKGHDPWVVEADPEGKIATTWFVDPDDSAHAVFLLTARVSCQDWWRWRRSPTPSSTRTSLSSTSKGQTTSTPPRSI